MSWTEASIIDVKRAVRLEDVIGREMKLSKNGDDLVGSCPLPGHDDSTPSFTVSTKKQLWHCKGCNKGGDVIAFLRDAKGLGFVAAMKMLSADAGVPLVDEARAAAPERKRVAAYDYQAADGTVLYTIERWEPGKNGRGKDFVQKLPDGTAKKSPVQVLYRLPLVTSIVANGGTVYVSEGEKAAEALIKLGVCGTTHAGGASALKTWTADFAAPLKGAHVVLLPDNDAVGADLMRHVAQVLKPLAASVRTLHLPVTGKGDDAVEWIAGGGTRQQLEALTATQPAQAEKAEWEDTLRYVGRYLVGSAANLEIILENDPLLRGVFAFDDFACRVVVMRAPPWRERGAVYPRALADHDVTRLGIYLERTFGTAFQGVGAVISSVADRAAFNPLLQYLNGLVWDGTPRLSTWLTTFAGAEDSPYTRAVARAWTISAIARAFVPGCQVDHTLVLEGDQGLGKSSLLRALVGSQWFLDHLPDFTSKDAAILVARAWVHELAELATLNKAEVEKIKQFLSQRDDVFRPPYGTNTKDVARKCVFAATTNRDDWARDTTGNRRFWPVVTGKLDVEGVAGARDQIWAEALVAFRAGERWHLTDSNVRAEAVEQQQARLERDPWQTKVQEYADAQVHRWITVDECLGVVGVEHSKRAPRDQSRVRDILRALGWKEARPRSMAGRPRVWLPPGWADEGGPGSGPGGGPGGSGTSGDVVGTKGPGGPSQNTSQHPPPHQSLVHGAVSGAGSVGVPSLMPLPLGPLDPLGPRAAGSRGKWSQRETEYLGPPGTSADTTVNEMWEGDR